MGRERRWRTLRFREGMLFQQAFNPLRVTLLDRLDKA
jgi:hypothetical protein